MFYLGFFVCFIWGLFSLFFFTTKNITSHVLEWKGMRNFDLRPFNKLTSWINLSYTSFHLSQRHYANLEKKKALRLLMNSINKSRIEGYIDLQYWIASITRALQNFWELFSLKTEMLIIMGSALIILNHSRVQIPKFIWLLSFSSSSIITNMLV